jgi:hypothetical protein
MLGTRKSRLGQHFAVASGKHFSAYIKFAVGQRNPTAGRARCCFALIRVPSDRLSPLPPRGAENVSLV